MHALRRRQEQIPCELEAHACDHDRDRDLGYGLCLAFLLGQSHGPFDLGLYLGHDGRGLRLGSRTVSTRCSPPHPWCGCRRRRDVHLDGQQQRTGGGQPARNTECTLHPWRDQATNSWSRHVEVARRDSARAVICRRQVATFRSKSRQCLHISLYISSKSPKISARSSDYACKQATPGTFSVSLSSLALLPSLSKRLQRGGNKR